MLRIIFSAVLAVVGVLAVFVFSPFLSSSKAQISDGKATVETETIETQHVKKMTTAKSEVVRLNAKFPGVKLSFSPATGAANFIRVKNSSTTDLAANAASLSAKRNNVQTAKGQNVLTLKSKSFFRENAALFGISDADDNLQMQKTEPDQMGGAHQTFQQYFNGVAVFAGLIKTHFDKNNNLYAAGGNVVPEIDVDATPNLSSDEAARTAAAKVSEENGVSGLNVASVKLFVFRTNLVKGIAGADRLVWEATVTNNSTIREFVYIDAHSGKFIEQFAGTPDVLSRRAFDGQSSTNPFPPNYPSNPFWVEGQAFPTGNTEADNMISSSGETYNFYKNAFGRDSFNATGGMMDAIFNRGNACPNASWDGAFISFCPGLTSDDVTAHEWSHAYTEYTDNLIYAWQPGALNEGYSDIFGETVDRLNNRDNVGNSLTDPARTADSCSTLTPVARRLRINSPTSIAESYNVGWAFFGPDLTTTPAVTADIVQAIDAADSTGPSTTDGCTALTNAAAVAGKIALIDRGTCGYKLKVLNAQNAGAVGVVVANLASNVNALFTLADDPSITTPITIPSVLTLYGAAEKIRSQISNGVNVSLTRTNNSDASTRWLIGEDNTGQLGILRDMYNPTCLTNPGKVTDAQYYTCSTQDRGGIHGNSGIVNHAYALLVDGGTYNGQTVGAIGLTKAAHIYFRAESVYQNQISDFAFHADALEQSATDLIGVNLNDLSTGAASGEIITAADVAQVRKTVLAVELRTPPTFCNFQPLLAKSPPAEPSCDAGTARSPIFTDNFESGDKGWTIGTQNTLPGFSLSNWKIVSSLPENRAGSAYFVVNTDNSCNAGTPDQTAIRFLKSPLITISSSYVNKMTLSFEHLIASETSYDGGQLWYSVNGGAFALVPQSNYSYNAPNLTLASAAANTNPRAGQTAWSGTDGGSVTGTFGQTVVDLSGLVNVGDTVQLRWDFGNDSCAGSTVGWYVDNVKINACFGPTAASVLISGRVLTGDGRGIANALVTMTDNRGAARTIQTNSFGNFNFGGVKAGADYVVNVSAKRYKFAPQIISATADISGLNFTAQP